MVSVWIGVVLVIMIVVTVGMLVPITMTMPVIMTMLLTMVAIKMDMGRGVKIFVRYFARADAFYMMMVAFLGQADLNFKAQDLLPIFAHQAVHIVGTF